jgi:hypothetical protein
MSLNRYKNKKGRKKRFTKQFKENLRIGLAAAVGFTVAFAWREPLILFSNDLVELVAKTTLPYSISIISAFLITFFGVLFLWILSRYLK